MCFLHVFQMHALSVSSVFRSMLQMVCLDVLKVDQVLLLETHLPQLLGRHRAGTDVREGKAKGARAGGRAMEAVFGRCGPRVGVQNKVYTWASRR